MEDAQQRSEYRRAAEHRAQMRLMEEQRHSDELERALQAGYAAGLLAMSPYARSSGPGVPGPVVAASAAHSYYR
jgi:hypothetical protein